MGISRGQNEATVIEKLKKYDGIKNTLNKLNDNQLADDYMLVGRNLVAAARRLAERGEIVITKEIGRGCVEINWPAKNGGQ